MKPTKVYVWRGRLLDVTEAALLAPEPRVHIIGDSAYQNLTVPGFDYKEGKPVAVPLDSYSKHRRYMREKGYAHVSDYNKPGGEWDRAAARRERIAKGEDAENNQRLHERVVDAVRRVEQGYRPPPAAPVDHVDSPAVIMPKE